MIVAEEEYESLAEYDRRWSEIGGDTDYLAIFGKANELLTGASMHQEVWERVELE